MAEADTEGAEFCRKEASGRRVAGAIKSLVNTRDFQIECARVLRETMHVPILTYGRKEKERSRLAWY